jgi:hypothetical protein
MNDEHHIRIRRTIDPWIGRLEALAEHHGCRLEFDGLHPPGDAPTPWFRGESPIESAFLVAFATVAVKQFGGVFLAVASRGQQPLGLVRLLPPESVITIRPQHPVGPYRVDALLELRRNDGTVASLVIECDGREFHTAPEDVQRDNDREYQLQGHGYTEIQRFTGAELWFDAFACAEVALVRLLGLTGGRS